jgi:hypothetical protein
MKHLLKMDMWLLLSIWVSSLSAFVTLMTKHCISFKSISHSECAIVQRSPDPWFAWVCCQENQTSRSFLVPSKKCEASINCETIKILRTTGNQIN